MTLLITFGIFLIVILLMAIGVMLNRRAIQGSCGGLNTMGIERACDCEEVCDEHKLYQISEPNEADKKE